MPKFVEYREGEPFPGLVGRTLDESEPAWPTAGRVRDGAPNVVLLVLDDVGFGQPSPFGGLCEMPTLDRIASRGLRYGSYQTTAMCSPTRGCLLTGRNHHTLGLAGTTEMSLGFPSHDAHIGFEHGFLSEILLEQGYSTFAIGKWHLTPPQETTAAGPFRRWPLGRGFERFYGFLGGDTDQWFPELVSDNAYVRAPYGPESGYHLNRDLADRAIGFVRDARAAASRKPFFLYWATGAGHAPHHVETEWAARYEGRFDDGWDAYRDEVFRRQIDLGIVPAGTHLSRRDPDVPAWDTLDADERRMFARQMEVYAGFLTQTDHHFGRFIDFLDGIGELDDTIVVAVSDNGASAEGRIFGSVNEAFIFNNVPDTIERNLAHFDDWGGVDTFPHYSWGWAWAGNVPYRRWKRETYRGGISDFCLVSWPAGIGAANEVRMQYAHAIDVAPTLLDAIGIEPPSEIRGVPQSPMHGVGFAHTFDDPEAESRHRTQYFEMFGHRSLYHEGWKAVCPWVGPSFVEAANEGRFFGLTDLTRDVLDRLDEDGWELYDLRSDPAETRDVAGDRPEQLRAMVERWWVEAERYGVGPLIGLGLARIAERPMLTGPRRSYVFRPGAAPLPAAACPRLVNRPYSIEAQIVVPDGGVEGIILSQGGRHGGFAFYMRRGRLCHVYNYVGLERWTLESPQVLAPGEHDVAFGFEPTGSVDLFSGKGVPARTTLLVDGAAVAEADIPHSTPILIGLGAGISCGYDALDTVDPGTWRTPFEFTGRIHRVVLELGGEDTVDLAAEVTRLLTQQ